VTGKRQTDWARADCHCPVVQWGPFRAITATATANTTTNNNNNNNTVKLFTFLHNSLAANYKKSGNTGDNKDHDKSKAVTKKVKKALQFNYNHCCIMVMVTIIIVGDWE